VDCQATAARAAAIAARPNLVRQLQFAGDMRFMLSVALLFALVRPAHAQFAAPPGMVEVPTPPPRPVAVELVPAVRHGHSVMWKTGAGITVASAVLFLAVGVPLTLHGLSGVAGEEQTSLIVGGMSFCSGAVGMLIVGPATWIAGIGRSGDPD
jgi:hypothetical protein